METEVEMKTKTEIGMEMLISDAATATKPRQSLVPHGEEEGEREMWQGRGGVGQRLIDDSPGHVTR